MKKLTLFLAIGIMVLGLSGTSRAALFGTSEYEFVSGNITWDVAEAASLSAGWHLVTITTSAEQTFVGSLLGGEGLVWAGGIQDPDPGLSTPLGGWNWVNSEGPFIYNDWATATAVQAAIEPNDWGGVDERYLALDGRFLRDWKWNDSQNTDAVLGYVRERTVAAVPEPSTLLLLGSGLVGLVGFGRKRMRK